MPNRLRVCRYLGTPDCTYTSTIHSVINTPKLLVDGRDEILHACLVGYVQLDSKSPVLGIPCHLFAFVGGLLCFLEVDIGEHDTFGTSLGKSECRLPSNARGSLRRAVSV